MNDGVVAFLVGGGGVAVADLFKESGGGEAFAGGFEEGLFDELTGFESRDLEDAVRREGAVAFNAEGLDGEAGRGRLGETDQEDRPHTFDYRALKK